jgi:hypothetical protein
MNIENKQLQKYINNLNNYANKENITLKDLKMIQNFSLKHFLRNLERTT